MSSSTCSSGVAWLSVSDLNARADALLRDRMGPVRVEGEVSNLRRYASGHQYFSLKDSEASISCTLFRGNLRHAAGFADGDHVRVTGRVGIYAARGQYQLIVERLEPAGEGRLLAAFEALRKRLLAEGLFAPERKRRLPEFVHRLGVITSAQGDVRHDIERTLARRFPLLLPFRLYPVAVQGAAAAEQIVAALQRAGDEQAVDVLILARGGGSLEDLWPFNSEEVARAIAGCPVPVVTGIGHETDTTIADFVADLRASTPTAAAEAVSPDGAVLLQRIHATRRRMQQRVENTAGLFQDRLRALSHRLDLRRPGRYVEQRIQRLDEHAERLRRALTLRLERSRLEWAGWQRRLVLQSPERRQAQLRLALHHLQHRLQQRAPAGRLARAERELARFKLRLRQAGLREQRNAGMRLQHLNARLEALSPDAALRRGYAILLTSSGEPVRSVSTLNPGQRLHGRVADGRLDLDVVAISATTSGEPRRR